MKTWAKFLSFVGWVYIVMGIIASIGGGIIVSSEYDSVAMVVAVIACGIVLTFISAAFLMAFAEMAKNLADIRENLKNSSAVKRTYRARVIKAFKDNKTGTIHNIGDIIELSEERYNKINSAGAYIEYVG